MISHPSMLKHIEDSIVHKKMMNNKSGSVTFFAMDDFESIAEHKNRHNEYVYIMDGQIELVVNNKSLLLSKGDFYAIGANNIHTVKGKRCGKFALVILKNKKGCM